MAEPVLGLDWDGIPDGSQPLHAVIIVKALDEDGDVAYYTRCTDDLMAVEALGMTSYAAAMLTAGLIRGDA